MDIKRKGFLAWERASYDTIDVKRIYVDIAGDLVTGIMLSQIMYWHLPDKRGHYSKMRVYRKEHYWLVKRNEDWWDEVRVKRSAACRALKRLEDKKLIITMLGKFKGAPTKHVRINWEVFLPTWKELLEKEGEPFTQNE